MASGTASISTTYIAPRGAQRHTVGGVQLLSRATAEVKNLDKKKRNILLLIIFIARRLHAAKSNINPCDREQPCSPPTSRFSQIGRILFFLCLLFLFSLVTKLLTFRDTFFMGLAQIIKLLWDRWHLI
jgi:hypothetical protein